MHMQQTLSVASTVCLQANQEVRGAAARADAAEAAVASAAARYEGQRQVWARERSSLGACWQAAHQDTLKQANASIIGKRSEPN